MKHLLIGAYVLSTIYLLVTSYTHVKYRMHGTRRDYLSWIFISLIPVANTIITIAHIVCNCWYASEDRVDNFLNKKL
jgi:hypothetical protein